MAISKIKYRRVYEDVIEQIENIILEENLSPGDVLPTERELSQALGISRGTLREAFRVLEREGLIETRPGGGRYLSSKVGQSEDKKKILENIEKATILDLLEARELFEAGIVQLAAIRATDQDIQEIKIALAKWGKVDSDADDPGNPDQLFHLSIAKATHNVALINLIELHMNLLKKTRIKTMDIPGRTEEIYKEHFNIFQAIQVHDSEKAKDALLYHLKRVKENIEIT